VFWSKRRTSSGRSPCLAATSSELGAHA
jgi:hypothetical protein